MSFFWVLNIEAIKKKYENETGPGDGRLPREKIIQNMTGSSLFGGLQRGYCRPSERSRRHQRLRFCLVQATPSCSYQTSVVWSIIAETSKFVLLASFDTSAAGFYSGMQQALCFNSLLQFLVSACLLACLPTPWCRRSTDYHCLAEMLTRLVATAGGKGLASYILLLLN